MKNAQAQTLLNHTLRGAWPLGQGVPARSAHTSRVNKSPSHAAPPKPITITRTTTTTIWSR